MTYFDLQVNGYAGVDFNGDSTTVDEILRVCERLRQENVVGILATIITDQLDVMCRRIRKIAELRHQAPGAAEVIRGVHIEGPFLNEQPGYIGAHPGWRGVFGRR